MTESRLGLVVRPSLCFTRRWEWLHQPLCYVHVSRVQWVLVVDAGQDNKEDCIEASMSVVQSCAHAPHQGTPM